MVDLLEISRRGSSLSCFFLLRLYIFSNTAVHERLWTFTIENISVHVHRVWFIKHFEISLAPRPGIAVTIIFTKFGTNLKMYREIIRYLLQ